MRIGITSPIVTRVPGNHGDWEQRAGITELSEIAAVADELGYAYLSCSEHVGVPVAAARDRGGTYWDPLATFGFLAARTTRIRLLTQVLVLGYHHPLEIVKRYGTLDTVSGGRLILGVGVGSLAAEFDLLGADFNTRGERADDALRALRVALPSAVADYQGTHYRFAGIQVEPHALQEQMPIWVGGRTQRSLRRAVELGNGWVPFAVDPKRVPEMLERAEAPADLEIVLSAGYLDPLRDPRGVTEALQTVTQAGATTVAVSIRATSVTDYIAGLERLAAEYPQTD